MPIEIRSWVDGRVLATVPGANLCGASLRGANLCGANLRGANLCDANLRGANLCDADLRGANLCGANLRGASLRGANLCGANLCGANLCDANLCDADLRGANLCDANLCDADLSPLDAARLSIVGSGDIIGYKKLANGVICKLLIPATAKRSNATGRKCRAEYAVVLEGEGYSQHDDSFSYKVGETVRPREPFDECRWNECTSGIHFFITREEAEAY